MSTPRRLADDDTLVPHDGPTQDRAGRVTSDDERELPRGTVLARYVILQRVGTGGMGVVYAAYDPQLDRRVAVKVLAAERSLDSQGRHRMLREAQAMARLTHPNVVTVHDVGLHDERTFIAMEYVDGCTIKTWLAAAPRTWREVLRVYVAAARGLVAAHAVGLVHRDFKPDNVMITEPQGVTEIGRVLVMDFGLARPIRAEDDVLAMSTTVGDGTTHTAGFIGTPAYMAPEQFQGGAAGGGAVGPRSDQFSFCVALYEGLFGHKPFLGDTVSALAAAVTLGHAQAPERRSGIPRALRQAVLRGLAADPAQRHASMADLLTILERDESRTRRNALAAGLAAATLAGSFAIGNAFDPAQRRCDRGAEGIDAVWSDERRAAIADAFAATGVPRAELRWGEVEALVATATERWRTSFVDACAATHLRGEQSDERLDARMRCLQDRRDRIDALLGELEVVDAQLVTRAAAAAHALPDIATCDDPRGGEFTALADEPGGPAAESVAAAERALAIAKARNDAGRYRQGILATNDALAELGEVGATRLRSEVITIRGQLQQRAGDAQAAEQTLRDALRIAVPGGHHEVAVWAWSELIFVIGSRLARPTEALALQLAAELELDALGGDDVLRRKLEGALAGVLQSAGRFDDALAHHQTALALAEATSAPPLSRMVVLGNYGNTLFELGRYREARDVHQRAYDLAVATLGDEHPAVAVDMMSLARDVAHSGDVERARQLYLRSIDVLTTAQGADNPGVADSLVNLALLEYGQLEYGPARAHGERALEIYTRVLGPDHPNVAAAHNHLGTVLHAEHDLDGAMRHYDEVARIYRTRFGDDHPKLAVAHNNRGNVQIERREFQAALELFDRAIAIELARLGPNHPSLAFEYIGQSRALVGLGRADEALVPAERALALREGVSVDPGELSTTHSALAAALWAAADGDGAMRARALDHGRRALVQWRQGGLDDPTRLAGYEQWLRDRGGDTSLGGD